MKHGLLALVAVVALAFAAPASAQNMWMDVNGDGVNTTADVLTSAVTSVDIWVDTDTNGDGSPAICSSSSMPFTINSYTLILQSTGGVAYGAWTDLMGFTANLGNGTAGNDAWIGWGSGTPLDPGTYKLGTQAVSVTGEPVLTFGVTTSASPTAMTSFGSRCEGLEFDNTLKLGSDWFDAQGTWPGTPVAETTWGKIKALYR